MEGAIRFENVGLRLGTGPEALSNIALELGRGEIAIVEGGPGAGKSALLALASANLSPSRGALHVLGREPATLAPHERAALKRRIGIISDSLPLVESLSIAENIALPVRIAGIARSERDERVREMLDWMGLAAHSGTMAGAASRGTREWTGIARAAILRPDLILADEPLALPDAQSAERLTSLFARLAELGSAVLIATRDARWTSGLHSARRLRLEQGRLTA